MKLALGLALAILLATVWVERDNAQRTKSWVRHGYKRTPAWIQRAQEANQPEVR